MKWSWKLGRIAGIDVFVHATFFILIAWIGIVSWSAGESLAAIAGGIGFILALFGCIVLHELGHALTARRYKIQTRDITLLPFGGIARLERMPDDPRQELVVALAGPAVNLVIAGVLAAWFMVSGGFESGAQMSVMEGPFLQRLMAVNVILLLFNLLPAFPMDGGRALRAVLAIRMDYVVATQIAANIGQAMAFVFGLIGLLYNPFLIFIAFFVWIGAAAEASMVQIKSALAGIPVAQAMLREFEILAPGDPLSLAVQMTLRGSQKDFPVVDEGAVVGMLMQDRLMAAIEKDGTGAPVSSALEKDVTIIDSHEMLEGSLARIGTAASGTMPVTHNGVLVGLLTLDNIGEFMRIQSALKARAARGGLSRIRKGAG